MHPRIRIFNSSIRCLYHVLPLANPTSIRHTASFIPVLRTKIPFELQIQSSNYATIAKTLAKYEPSPDMAAAAAATDTRSHPPTQPPSYKSPASTKTLLLRVYLSLLRSSPVTLIFQHNAVTAAEWGAIRRELSLVMAKVDVGLPEDSQAKIGQYVRVNAVHTAIFGVAVRIADKRSPEGDLWSHGTGVEAAEASRRVKTKHKFTPLMVGPLGIVTFPILSVPHVEAAVNMLFPAKLVTKKGSDPAATAGLAKCILLGARVREKLLGQRKVMDNDGIKWLCGLRSVDELRAEIVSLLQSIGGSELVAVLQGAAVSLGRTVEARRKMLEEPSAGAQSAEAKA